MKSDICEFTDKKKFSYSKAKKMAKYLRRHKPMKKVIAQAYRCKDCHFWHVGNR